MSSTIALAATVFGLTVVSAVLWALFLRIGLRWAKVPNSTTRRVALAAALAIVLQVAINTLFFSFPTFSADRSILLGLVQLAAVVVAPCAVISVLFKTRFVQTVQAWLPTLLTSVATLGLVLVVLRPFLYDAFVVPTNGMAPTLLGKHWRGVCPECGKPNYCSPRDERDGAADPPLMICDSFHVTRTAKLPKAVQGGDRFLAAKFLTPQRWDLVVFQYPEKPATLYVQRLVGFPGETVHLEDGAVWIDGIRQTPPDSLEGIEYLSKLPDGLGPDLWGSKERPARLGSDEYFVLGDFSAQSRDSRFWEQGAPGHNPFAVPASHIKGVATHTYWPPHRWRVHR